MGRDSSSFGVVSNFTDCLKFVHRKTTVTTLNYGHPGAVAQTEIVLGWPHYRIRKEDWIDRRVTDPTKPSAHQLEGIGEELRTAEIARFQRKQHVAPVRADGTQNRHACSDFWTDEESGNAQPVDHRA